MKIITLREPAECLDCGKHLPAGTRARYYSIDKIYCETHDNGPAARGPATREPAAREARPLFPEDPDMEAWIQFFEEVQAALMKLIYGLRGS